MKEIPAWVREMDDDTAFMQLVLSNAQGELSNLERGMHALAATTKHDLNGKSIEAYARAIGINHDTLKDWIWAAEVYHMADQPAIARDLAKRTTSLSNIHPAPKHCWRALVQRLIKEAWSKDQTVAAVRAVNAVRPPRGYEKLFAVEKLQEMAAAGQDPNEATRLAIRAIERARADIRDVQFASAILGNSQDRWAWPHPSTPVVNLHRRHLDESQRAMGGAKLVAIYAEDARNRQATSTGGAQPQLSANWREADPATAGKAAEKAAEVVNVSTRSIERAIKVVEKPPGRLRVRRPLLLALLFLLLPLDLRKSGRARPELLVCLRLFLAQHVDLLRHHGFLQRDSEIGQLGWFGNRFPRGIDFRGPSSRVFRCHLQKAAQQRHGVGLDGVRVLLRHPGLFLRQAEFGKRRWFDNQFLRGTGCKRGPPSYGIRFRAGTYLRRGSRRAFVAILQTNRPSPPWRRGSFNDPASPKQYCLDFDPAYELVECGSSREPHSLDCASTPSAHVGCAKSAEKETTMNATTETTSTATAAAVAEAGTLDAPKKAAGTKTTTTRKAAPKAAKPATNEAAAGAGGAASKTPKAAKKAAKGASTKAKATKTAKAATKATTAALPKEFSKKQIVLDLLKAKGGATLDEIMAATAWQRHSARGFLSTAGKTFQITVAMEGDVRRYKIAK